MSTSAREWVEMMRTFLYIKRRIIKYSSLWKKEEKISLTQTHQRTGTTMTTTKMAKCRAWSSKKSHKIVYKMEWKFMQFRVVEKLPESQECSVNSINRKSNQSFATIYVSSERDMIYYRAHNTKGRTLSVSPSRSSSIRVHDDFVCAFVAHSSQILCLSCHL